MYRHRAVTAVARMRSVVSASVVYRSRGKPQNSEPVVYHADDRPYGLIEGSVVRDEAPPADVAWLGTPGFC